MSIKSIIEKPKEIWVLGSHRYKGADRNLKWNSYFPNFVDCDILLIDLLSLKLSKLKKVYNKLDEESHHIAEMIKLGGTMICITAPHIRKYVDYRYVDNYSWLPIYPEISDITPGEKIFLEKNVFCQKYYNYVDEYYFKINRATHKGIKDSYAITKARNILGFSIEYSYGFAHFLPPPTSISSKQGIEFIIQDIKRQDDELTKIPDEPRWMENYVSQSEKNAMSELHSYYLKIKEKEKDLKNHKEINRVVWACGDLNKGKILENAVKSLFEKELGCIVFKTDPGAHADLKIIFPDGNKKFAIEITGVKGKITNSSKKCPQITHYHWNKEPNEKILFIANTYCDKDVKDRPSENFSRDVEETLKRLNVCLITTVQLYELWKEMKKGKISKKAIIDKLYKTDGVFNNK